MTYPARRVPRTSFSVAVAAAILLPTTIPAQSAPRSSADQSALTITRTRIGDTVIVRNTGTSGKWADFSLTEEMRIVGDDIPGTPGLTAVSFVTPALDGGVLFFDQGQRRIVQFDSAGAFKRFVGAYGAGPGEYTGVRGIHVARDGRILMVQAFGDGNLYSPSGQHLLSWPRVAMPGVATLGSVDENLLMSIRTSLPVEGHRDSLTAFGTPAIEFAVVRFFPDSMNRDSIYAPRAPREQKMLEYRSSASNIRPGAVPSTRIPLVPYHIVTFSSAGYWIGGDPERYSLTLFNEGAPMRIESEHPRVAASVRERQNLLDNHLYRMRAQGSQFNAPLTIVPATKPAFKALATDVDGRIWVQLHAPGAPVPVDTIALREAMMRNEYTIVDGQRLLRPTAPVAPGRPSVPTERWEEPQVYEVFASTGEFLGRMRVPVNATWLNASRDRVWFEVRDADDVPTVVRYRFRRGG